MESTPTRAFRVTSFTGKSHNWATRQRYQAAFTFLIIFSLSNAGYFTANALSFHGKFGRTVLSSANPLSVIGTLASVVCGAVLVYQFLVLHRFEILRALPTPFIILFVNLIYFLFVSAFQSALLTDCVVLFLKSIIYYLAMYIAYKRFSNRQLPTHIAGILIGVCLVSAVLSTSDPQFSVSANDFANLSSDFRGSAAVLGWRGLFLSKNSLGAFCLFSIALLLFFYPEFKSKRLSWLSFVVVIATLLASRSRTSIMTSAFMLTWTFLLPWAEKALRSRSLGVFFVVVVCLFVAGLSETTFLSQETFTGRTDIWKYYISIAEQHWLVGSGGLAAQSPQLFLAARGYLGQTSTHNSFINVFLDGGIIGLCLFCWLLASFCYFFLNLDNSHRSLVGVGTVIGFSIYGMFESDASYLASLGMAVLIIEMTSSERKMRGPFGMQELGHTAKAGLLGARFRSTGGRNDKVPIWKQKMQRKPNTRMSKR